jgi:hypothetical protein
VTTPLGYALTRVLELAAREKVAPDLLDAIVMVKAEHVNRLHGNPARRVECSRGLAEDVRHERQE